MRALSNNRPPISKRDISAPLHAQPARTDAAGKVLSNPPLPPAPKLKISSPKDGRPIPDSLRGSLPPLTSHAYDTAPGATDMRPQSHSGPVQHDTMPTRAKWMDSLGGEAKANQESKHEFLQERAGRTKETFRQDPSVANEISMREADHNLRSFLNHGDMDLVSRNSPTPHLDNVGARRDVVRSREEALKTLSFTGSTRGLQKGEPASGKTTGFKEELKRAKGDHALALRHLADYEGRNASQIKTELRQRNAHMASASPLAADIETTEFKPTLHSEDMHAERPKVAGHVGFAPYAKHEEGSFGGIKNFDGLSKTPGRQSKLRGENRETPNPFLDVYPREAGHVPKERKIPGRPGSTPSPEPSLESMFPRGETGVPKMGRDSRSQLGNLQDMYREAKNEHDLVSGGEKHFYTDDQRTKAKQKLDHYKAAVKAERAEANKRPVAVGVDDAETASLGRTSSSASTRSSQGHASPLQPMGLNVAGVGANGYGGGTPTRLGLMQQELGRSHQDVARMEARVARDPSQQNLTMLNGARDRVVLAERMIREEGASTDL